jgi:hypothetical protein
MDEQMELGKKSRSKDLTNFRPLTIKNMAPNNLYDTSATRITSSGLVSVMGYGYYGYYQSFESYRYNEIKETDQEKRDRISLDKKLASQKVYNDKTTSVKFIKQICKPQHRISHGAYRGMR